MEMFSTQNVCILVVDSDLSLRVANLLRSKYEVVTTTTGGAALQILRQKQHGISLVVTDLNLPDMSSSDFLQIVETETRLPVVMMSDMYDEHLVMHGLSIGAMMFLLKPLCDHDIQHMWQLPIVKQREVLLESLQPTMLDIPEESSNVPVRGSRQSPHVIPNNQPTVPESSNGSQRNGKRKVDDMQRGHCWSVGQPSAPSWTQDPRLGFLNIAQHSGVPNASPSAVAQHINFPGVATNHAATSLQRLQMYFSIQHQLQLQSPMVHPLATSAIPPNPNFMMAYHMGQAPNGNHVQPPNGYHGQAANGNYGQAANGNQGQAPNGNHGQAANGNYGQAPNGNQGQAPNGNNETIHRAERESALTALMRNPYTRGQLTNIIRGSLSRWGVQYGSRSSDSLPPLTSTTVVQGGTVVQMSVPIALANELERFIYAHLNATYGQPRGFVVPLPQRMEGNGEQGPSFLGALNPQAVLNAISELLNDRRT